MKNLRSRSKQLKNFAPKSFKATSIIWTEKETQVISWLKKRYQFDNDFDLHAHLAHMPIDIMSFKEYDRQIPTIKDTIHSLNLIKKQSIILQNSLSDTLLHLIDNVRNNAKILLDMLEITGSKHRTLIAKNTPNNYKTLHKVINLLETFTQDDSLPWLHIMLDHIINGVDKTKATLPSPKRGRKKINLERAIIHKLLQIYIHGTSKRAACNYNRTTGQYYGQFYYFLINTLILLRRKTRIKVIERGTWGDYAKETIKHHYRSKEMTSSQ